MNDDLPTLPTDPHVIEFGERNVSRSCEGCDGEADFYVIVTNEMANDRLGTGLDHDEWPVNAYLCRECFAEAPRVDSWEQLVEAV